MSLFCLPPFNCDNVDQQIFISYRNIKKTFKAATLIEHKYALILKMAKMLRSKYCLYSTVL